MNKIKNVVILFILICFVINNNYAQISNKQQSVTIKNFIIYEKDAKLFIDWATDGTVATNIWKVQSSTDKVQFTTIALVLGNDPGQQGDNYKYKEKLKEYNKGVMYYRLCHVDANGNEQFTEILTPAK